MKTAIVVLFILIGATLVSAPLICTVILQLTGQNAHLSEGVQLACWIPGGVLLGVGIITSFFCRSRERDRLRGP
jgi:hypothetical protein